MMLEMLTKKKETTQGKTFMLGFSHHYLTGFSFFILLFFLLTFQAS